MLHDLFLSTHKMEAISHVRSIISRNLKGLPYPARPLSPPSLPWAASYAVAHVAKAQLNMHGQGVMFIRVNFRPGVWLLEPKSENKPQAEL